MWFKGLGACSTPAINVLFKVVITCAVPSLVTLLPHEEIES